MLIIARDFLVTSFHIFALVFTRKAFIFSFYHSCFLHLILHVLNSLTEMRVS